MSFLKGLESFQARMEEDATVEETSVDVEVKVAEEVEAATQIVEEATSVIADAEASDAAAEDVEAVEHFIASIKKHGLTQQGLELMNRNGILEAISGVALPAVESLDSTGRNHEAAQAALEASEGIVKKSWEAIKKFFKTLWEKIKALWAKFMSYITSWESSIKKAHDALPTGIDSKKAKDKDVTTLKYAQFGAMCGGVAQIVIDLAADQFKDVSTKGSVQKHYKQKESGLLAIGLKFDGDDIVSTDKAPEATSMKFSASGWTIDNLKGDGFKGAQSVVSAMRGIKDFPAAFGKMCDGASKMADSLAKSNGKEDEKEKEEMKNVRENVSLVSKVAAKVASRSSVVPRAYISACAAAKACAA